MVGGIQGNNAEAAISQASEMLQRVNDASTKMADKLLKVQVAEQVEAKTHGDTIDLQA